TGSRPEERAKQEPQKSVINLYINGHMVNTSPDYDKLFYESVENYKLKRWPGKTQRKIGPG
ncbi:MAG: hypothetical protein MUD10_03220, partial [Candidatus Pacebacteria bacterium]|nr:hypothetical protein [Candidatus Paceibacterota bacterium]